MTNNKFFYDTTPRLSGGVREMFLEHRFKNGWVGIEFRGWGSRREWYVPKLRGIIDEDMIIDQPSGTTIIRVQILGLPRLDLWRQNGWKCLGAGGTELNAT